MRLKNHVLIEALPKLYKRQAEPQLITYVKQELRFSGILTVLGQKPTADQIWSSVKAEDFESYFPLVFQIARPADNKVVRSTIP